MDIQIRQETRADMETIENVIAEAFQKEEVSDQTEHELVKRIRQSEAYIPELALSAFLNGTIAGHIMLSRIDIEQTDQTRIPSLALAPVSVLPELQGRGIGSALIHDALQRAASAGYPSVIVLGHPDYYPRFGFQPASGFGVRAPFDVPDEALMAMELEPGTLQSGTIRYPAAFQL
ncbi:GNAT family N-acetyltransferase [Alkalicoccus luteus]|uniref:GNAT family N-acetyltransferase n=1 Tax=Alkalicoccus luteus TaxID=1237094 RepID=UPI00403368A4